VTRGEPTALRIGRLRPDDVADAERVLDSAIRDVWVREGIDDAVFSVDAEVSKKVRMLRASLKVSWRDSDAVPPAHVFLTASDASGVIGTVSFGPRGAEILDLAAQQTAGLGELGGLYVLPERQGAGVASRLIDAMIGELRDRGIQRFCLDTGYRSAQARWIRRFGEPEVVAADYWGPGTAHLVWISAVTGSS
jgi:GNAT superfamily N-acetyltransferase